MSLTLGAVMTRQPPLSFIIPFHNQCEVLSTFSGIADLRYRFSKKVTNVSATPKSTRPPLGFTPPISLPITIMETSPESTPTLFPTSTFSWRIPLPGFFPSQATEQEFQDTRGTLFFDLCRIAATKRPRLLLFENVRDCSPMQETHIRTSWPHWTSWGMTLNGRYAIANTSECLKTENVSSYRHIFEEHPDKGVSSPTDIASSYWGSSVHRLSKQTPTSRPCDACGTITCTYRGKQTATEGRTASFRWPRRGLSVLECERLQGFPDDWTAGLSNSMRYKCVATQSP